MREREKESLVANIQKCDWKKYRLSIFLLFRCTFCDDFRFHGFMNDLSSRFSPKMSASCKNVDFFAESSDKDVEERNF